jgi:hypothetical protein
MDLFIKQTHKLGIQTGIHGRRLSPQFKRLNIIRYPHIPVSSNHVPHDKREGLQPAHGTSKGTPFHAKQHEWQIPQTHQHTSDNHDKYMVRATSTRQNRAGSRRVDSCVIMTYSTADT